jgi:hypothetical protein
VISTRPTDLPVLRHLCAGDDDVEGIALALYPLPRLVTPPRTAAEWSARSTAVAAHWRAARAEVSASLRALVRAGYVARTSPPRLAPGIAERIDLAAEDFRTHWREYTRRLGWSRRPDARQAWLLGAERVVRDAILYADTSDEVAGIANFPTYAVLLWRVRKGPTSVRRVLGKEPGGHTKRVWAALVGAGLVLSPSQRCATEAGRALIETSQRETA